MVNVLKLNRLIINNTAVIIDCFISKKYNSLVVICNNYNYCLEGANVNVRDIKWRVCNSEDTSWNTFKLIDVKDSFPMEVEIPNLNMKDHFNKGFHHDILIYPNFPYSNTSIELLIGNSIYSFNVENESRFHDKKCMTTIQKDEVHLIPSWIEYHKKLGFEAFIIYDNNLNIESYNQFGEKYNDCLYIIDANFPYWLYSYVMASVGQTIQQNHCIWKYCPQFLALTDLDEYITSSQNIFNTSISVLSFPNLWFGCNHNTKYDFTNFIYKLTKREDSSKAVFERYRKCIIQPLFVDLFCVHIPLNYEGEFKRIKYDEGYIRHYLILSAKNRGCDCNTNCKIDDIIGI